MLLTAAVGPAWRQLLLLLPDVAADLVTLGRLLRDDLVRVDCCRVLLTLAAAGDLVTKLTAADAIAAATADAVMTAAAAAAAVTRVAVVVLPIPIASIAVRVNLDACCIMNTHTLGCTLLD